MVEKQPQPVVVKELVDTTDSSLDIIAILKNTLPKTKKEWTILIVVTLIIVGLLLFSFNQFLGIQYKLELLQTPCNLCNALQTNNGTYVGIDWNNFNKTNLINFTIIPS